MSLSNSLGLLGRKVGMMRLFTDDGDAVPVTVVDVSNNRVTQVKTQANDGYDALQVTFGKRRAACGRRLAPAAAEAWAQRFDLRFQPARHLAEHRRQPVLLTRAGQHGEPGVGDWTGISSA